jgi:hypothetical protein
MNSILIRENYSQIFEYLRAFKVFITYAYTAIFPSILIAIHNHILSFLSVYFSLLAINKASVFFSL